MKAIERPREAFAGIAPLLEAPFRIVDETAAVARATD